MGFIKRLTNLILITDTNDRQDIQLIRDIQQRTNIIIRILLVLCYPVPDLTPATAQSQILRLQLHINRSDRSVLDPNIAFQHIRQDNHGQGTTLQKSGTIFLTPGSFFNISLSSTTTNCQGLLRFEAGAINAAFKISSTCSGESSCSVNLRVLLLFCISVAKLSIFFVLCTLLILRFANINIIFCTHIYVSFFFLVSIFIIEQ